MLNPNKVLRLISNEEIDFFLEISLDIQKTINKRRGKWWEDFWHKNENKIPYIPQFSYLKGDIPIENERLEKLRKETGILNKRLIEISNMNRDAWLIESGKKQKSIESRIDFLSKQIKNYEKIERVSEIIKDCVSYITISDYMDIKGITFTSVIGLDIYSRNRLYNTCEKNLELSKRIVIRIRECRYFIRRFQALFK